MSHYKLYGINFKKTSGENAVELIKEALFHRKKMIVFTPNLQIIGECVKDKRLVNLLNTADLLLPDGIGISILGKKRGIYGIKRITGIDTAYSLLNFAAEEGLRVFLLGGKAGVARLAADNLKKQFPTLLVCGTHHGYFDKRNNAVENQAVLQKIQRARPDILFVCFGFPEQEKWISQNHSLVPTVSLFMGLGGSLDVWAGTVRRAPSFFRRIHLEWLWRCTCQPRRFIPLMRSFFVLLKSQKKEPG